MHFQSILALAHKKQTKRDEEVKRDSENEKRRQVQRQREFVERKKYETQMVKMNNNRNVPSCSVDEHSEFMPPTNSTVSVVPHAQNISVTTSSQSLKKKQIGGTQSKIEQKISVKCCEDTQVKKSKPAPKPRLSFADALEIAKKNVEKYNSEPLRNNNTTSKTSDVSKAEQEIKSFKSGHQSIPRHVKPTGLSVRSNGKSKNVNPGGDLTYRARDGLKSRPTKDREMLNKPKRGIALQLCGVDSSVKSHARPDKPIKLGESSLKPPKPIKSSHSSSIQRFQTMANSPPGKTPKQPTTHSSPEAQFQSRPARGIAAQFGLIKSQPNGRMVHQDSDDYASDDSFIDDSDAVPAADYARVVRDIHKSLHFDPRKYKSINPYDDLKTMESDYRQIEREEKISSRLGAKEDYEDMMEELARKKRKLIRTR